MTAQLPVVRVSSDSHRIVYPFAAAGLDYFGPLYVKTGPNTRSRKNATLNKSYGCIFTCSRYRAVHIEVAEDVSTDSFMISVGWGTCSLKLRLLNKNQDAYGGG